MIGSVDVGRDEFSALISPDSPVITISWCSSCRVQQRKRGARDSLVVLTTTKRNALCVCGAHSCVCVISSENNTSVRVENDKNLIIFWVFFQIKKKKHCFLCVDLVWWWPHRNYIVIFFSTLNWNEIPHGKHNINCRYGELRNFCFSFFCRDFFFFPFPSILRWLIWISRDKKRVLRFCGGGKKIERTKLDAKKIFRSIWSLKIFSFPRLEKC
jgi:hypothetical protein